MKKLEPIEPEPEFNYNFLAELDFDTNPKALFNWIQAQGILCSKCHKKKKVYFKPKFIKIKCDPEICGTTLIYPKRKDRNNCYLVRHVSAHEVKRDGRRRKNEI